MMISYLLGEMSSGERAELEERYFADDDLFNELVCLENEIIDFYVQGKVSKNEQRQFERFFLVAPERQEKVRFAKSLLNHVKRKAEVQDSTTERKADQRKFASALHTFFSSLRPQGLPLAAIFVTVAAIGLWLFLVNHGIQREPILEPVNAHPKETKLSRSDSLTSLPSQRATGNNEKHEIVQSQPSATVALVLSDGLARSSGEQPSLLITPDISRVRLQLTLESDRYSNYTVRLETAEGEPVWQGRHIKSHADRDTKAITVELQSKLLPSGDYIVRLSGAKRDRQEEVEAYGFRVLNNQHVP
ncbi:MAG: hypothetical protein DMG67_00510 [Acidobacteria bacterium]|nr:MAG: hypothetical protein DMG67_00510 [Acidobacteriota bacterium]